MAGQSCDSSICARASPSRLDSMKLGRLPRAHNPAVPHMSALLAGQTLLPIPMSVDYTTDMGPDFGAMGNSDIGDCTAAAYFHARQIWSFNATHSEITAPDSDVIGLYSASTGYQPGNPTTDQGGVEQDVLTYLLNHGAPNCKPILAFIEVDSRNLDDVRRTIYECGVAYIGVNLPQTIVSGDAPPDVWDAVPGDTIAGGHAIALCGYDIDGFTLISWGNRYTATNAFMANYCDEVYAIADPEWITATNKTPLGMTLQQLEQQMSGLREAA